MAYGKKTYKRSKRYRRPYKRRYKSVRKDIAIIKKKLKDRKPEMKYFDRALIATDLVADTPASYSVFTGMTRGSEKNTYIGDNIRIKSIQIKGRITTNVATNLVRYKFILVKDRKSSVVAAPTAVWSNVYEDDTLFSLRNMDYTTRLQLMGVVAQGTLILDVDGTMRDNKIVNFYKKCNIPIKFEASDPDSPVTNDIVLMMLTDGTVSLDQADEGLNVRIRFEDA